jgi:hypothetical protein
MYNSCSRGVWGGKGGKFFKTVRKVEFFDAPFDLFKKKGFHLLEGTMNLIEELKKFNNGKNAQYFKKQLFINRS